MILVGRVLSTFAAAGAALLLALVKSVLRAEVNANPALLSAANLLGALTAFAFFIGWGLAVYHWGSRYRGERKGVWGIVVILGVFIGALFYWWAGARAGDEYEARRA